jgi:hypothetical protein
MGPKLKKVVEEATQDDPIVGPTIQTLRDDLIAGQQDLKKNFTDFLEKNQASQDFSQASQNALQESQNVFQTTLLALLVTRQEVTSSTLKDSPVTVIEPGKADGKENFEEATPDLGKSSSPHALLSMLHRNSPPSNEIEVKSLSSSFQIPPPRIPIDKREFPFSPRTDRAPQDFTYQDFLPSAPPLSPYPAIAQDYSYNSGISRTILPIKPSESTVRLTNLQPSSVYRWLDALVTEQQDYPHDTLQHSRYITPEMTHYILALNEQYGYISRMITLRGQCLALDNFEIGYLLKRIVGAKSEQEWIITWHNLLQFPQLSTGYQIDPANWTPMNFAVIKYIYNTNRVLTFLQAVAGQDDHSPSLHSSKTHKGLIQLFYEKIPQQYGLLIHNSLSQEQIKLSTSMAQYIYLFKLRNQQYNTDSDAIKRNRLACDTKYNTNLPLVPYDKSQHVGSPSVKPSQGAFQGNSQRHQVNTGTSLHRQNNMFYLDPHQPNQFSRDNEFNSHRYTDTYNDNFTEDLNDYDFFDASQKAIANHNGLDPLYKYNDNSGSTEEPLLNAIDKTQAAQLPCFKYTFTACDDRQCIYSHDKRICQQEFDRREALNKSSIFNRNQTGNNTNKHPNSAGILKDVKPPSDRWGHQSSPAHSSQYQTKNFRQLQDIPVRILEHPLTPDESFRNLDMNNAFYQNKLDCSQGKGDPDIEL